MVFGNTWCCILASLQQKEMLERRGVGVGRKKKGYTHPNLFCGVLQCFTQNAAVVFHLECFYAFCVYSTCLPMQGVCGFHSLREEGLCYFHTRTILAIFYLYFIYTFKSNSLSVGWFLTWTSSDLDFSLTVVIRSNNISVRFQEYMYQNVCFGKGGIIFNKPIILLIKQLIK